MSATGSTRTTLYDRWGIIIGVLDYSYELVVLLNIGCGKNQTLLREGLLE